MSVNMCAVADAMCCESESQIRITSSCLGAGVDILTLTLSHVGLGVQWKVLTVVLKVQELYLIHINFKNFRKLMTHSQNTDRLCNAAAEISALLRTNDMNTQLLMVLLYTESVSNNRSKWLFNVKF